MTVTGSTMNAGTVTFQVDGIGRYDFSKTLTMEITKATPQVTRTGAASYIYDGKAKSSNIDFIGADGSVLKSVSLSGKLPGT